MYSAFVMTLAVALHVAVLPAPAHHSPRGSAGVTRQPRAGNDPSLFGVFAGSTPCCDRLGEVLRIPHPVNAELSEWTITLYQDPKTQLPATYRLRVRYGPSVPGRPGLAENARALERTGTWRISRGIKGHPSAPVYELQGSVSLVGIADTVLHLLKHGDRSLMVGHDGWSYTLNRTVGSEPRVDPSLDRTASMNQTLLPLPAASPAVAVFGGRSPCQGIARELEIRVDPSCARVKWRLVFFYDSQTGEPAVYRVESTLHHQAREGRWTIERGTQSDPNATVYRLAPANGEAPLLLLKGDDNVLFFLDRNRRPLTGHSELSYTVNRRTS